MCVCMHGCVWMCIVKKIKIIYAYVHIGLQFDLF